jgi:hypothetical protein
MRRGREGDMHTDNVCDFIKIPQHIILLCLMNKFYIANVPPVSNTKHEQNQFSA